MRRALALALVLALAAPFSPALAQGREETLADIRQELSVLWVEIQRLRTELSTTGSPTGVSGGDTIARIDAIESELRRLTNATEELQIRVDRVVMDGTNRIGDLEFRLCELLNRRGRLALAGSTVFTSARRFRKLGAFRTYFRMWRVTVLYHLGVKPEVLKGIYEKD